MLSLISFTLRPGPLMQEIENANDTRTNSSNVTVAELAILKSFQSSELSDLVTNSFTAAFTSNLKSSLNVTQESLEKIQLQVTSNITLALRNILLLTLNDNEGILSAPDEAAIRTLWYTSNPQNESDYLTDAYNESAMNDANSTADTIIDNIEPAKSGDDDWCVVICTKIASDHCKTIDQNTLILITQKELIEKADRNFLQYECNL